MYCWDGERRQIRNMIYIKWYSIRGGMLGGVHLRDTVIQMCEVCWVPRGSTPREEPSMRVSAVRPGSTRAERALGHVGAGGARHERSQSRAAQGASRTHCDGGETAP